MCACALRPLSLLLTRSETFLVSLLPVRMRRVSAASIRFRVVVAVIEHASWHPGAVSLAQQSAIYERMNPVHVIIPAAPFVALQARSLVSLRLTLIPLSGFYVRHHLSLDHHSSVPSSQHLLPFDISRSHSFFGAAERSHKNRRGRRNHFRLNHTTLSPNPLKLSGGLRICLLRSRASDSSFPLSHLT